MSLVRHPSLGILDLVLLKIRRLSNSCFSYSEVVIRVDVTRPFYSPLTCGWTQIKIMIVNNLRENKQYKNVLTIIIIVFSPYTHYNTTLTLNTVSWFYVDYDVKFDSVTYMS